jgi:exopolysaccharide biosynthesis predicted pyruvyltransferase EpsI
MDDFERIILSYKDFNFNVIEPGGNYGDVLIYKGVEKILKKAGIKYKKYRYKSPNDIVTRILWTIARFVESVFPKIGIRHDKCKRLIARTMQSLFIVYCVNKYRIDFNKEELILIQGGGDFNDTCSPCGIHILKTILKYCPENTLIIAPQTYYFEITNFPKLFTNYKGKAYLFCRGEFSYELLRRMKFPQNVKVLQSPDTSFYSLEDILPFYEKNAQANSSSYNLLAFREDVESIINNEIKELIKTKILSMERILESDISKRAKNLSEFLNLIFHSKRVYTDRLHVGIVAAVFGKKVFLFPCCYWKTEGVYLYNLRKYSNVVYVDKCNLENRDKLVELLS